MLVIWNCAWSQLLPWCMTHSSGEDAFNGIAGLTFQVRQVCSQPTLQRTPKSPFTGRMLVIGLELTMLGSSLTYQCCCSAAEHLRASLESLFNQYNVDLVVSGHVHSYARTCNVYDEKCVDNLDKGTTHVTLGCGGHKLSDVDHDQYDWLDYSETKYGYGRVTADGDHSLRLEYITTNDGDIRDTVTLHNDYDGRDYCRGHGHRRYIGIQPAGGILDAQAASSLTASQ